MKKIIKYVFAFIGFIFLILFLNFMLAYYYLQKHQSSVEGAINIYLHAKITGDTQTTYQFLSSNTKSNLSYDSFVQLVKDFDNSGAPTAKSCEITGMKINSVLSTSYIGPEAEISVECLMSDDQTFYSQYPMFLENGEWKLR